MADPRSDAPAAAGAHDPPGRRADPDPVDDDALIDEMSMESFPASDPPTSTRTGATPEDPPPAPP